MRTKLFRELVAALLCGLLLLQSATAAAPGWWSERGVIAANKPADDYAALNQGQLKLLASKAWLHMELGLPGGAGPELTQMISGWRLVKPQTDDFAVVNVGQLKTVARPFYKRLSAAGLAALPAWTTPSSTSSTGDYAVVNLGQAKTLFSFAIPQALGSVPQRLSGHGMAGLGGAAMPAGHAWGSGRPPLVAATGLAPPGVLPSSTAEVSTTPSTTADWNVVRQNGVLIEYRIAGGGVSKTAEYERDDQGTSDPNDDEWVRNGWYWNGWASGGGPGEESVLSYDVKSTGELESELGRICMLSSDPVENHPGVPELGLWSNYDSYSFEGEEHGANWNAGQMQLRVSGAGLADAPGAWWQVHRTIRNEDWESIEHTTEFLPVVVQPSREESETVTVTSQHWDTPGEFEEVWVKLVKPTYIQVNDGDADGDEVPDHADGQEETYPDPEDEPDLPQTAPLAGMPGVFGNSETRVRYHLDGENLRLWRQELFKSHQVNRDPRPLAAGGDLVPWDEWTSYADLGQVLVESLAPSTAMHDQVVTMEVDGDGDGPEPPIVYHRSYFTSIGSVLEKVVNGKIGERDRRMQPSLPNPTIDLQNVSVTNARVADDGSGLLADIAFSGKVRSAVCDLTPGEETGAITSAYASVNGEPLPQSVVTVAVSKRDTPAGQDRPYPYQGTFNHTLTGVKVTEGKNTLGLIVSDPLYHLSGTAEVGFEIDATPPAALGEGTGSEVMLELPVAGSTLAADEARLTVTADDVTLVHGVVLKRQAGNALLYRSTDGQAVFQFTQAPSLTSTTAEAVHGFVTLPQSGWQGAAFSPLVETEINSGAFVWSAQEQYAGYWGWSVSVGAVEEAVESGAGDFHAYTVRLQGPLALLAQVRHIHLGGQALPVVLENDIARVADAQHPDQPLTLASLPVAAVQPPEPAGEGGSSPGLAELGIGENWEDLDIPEEVHDLAESNLTRREDAPQSGLTLMNRIKRQAGVWLGDHSNPAYYHGFVSGFLENPKDTGKDAVVTLVGLGEKAVHVASLTHPLGMVWEFTFGDAYHGEIQAAAQAVKRAKEIGGQAYHVLQEWGPAVTEFLWKLNYQANEAVVRSALLGEFPQKQKMGPELQLALEVLSQLMILADDAWAGMDAYHRGYWQGYIAFEVFIVVVAAVVTAPEVGVGGAAMLARHAPKLTRRYEFLDKLLDRLSDVPQLGKLVDKIREFIAGANAAGSFCFVAGTLVLTLRGMRPIEQVKAGDYVWSRDDETGKWGWRPVLKTFVTHPDTLVHVRYETAGVTVDEEASDGLGLMRNAVPNTANEAEIVGTEGHPFHVRRAGMAAAFLAASALQTGDVLTLADGRDAAVREVRVEQAAEDRLFTTYNFTVADHHTYFAGTLPVWVHNTGLADCDRVLKIFDYAFKKNGNNWQKAWESVIQRLPKLGLGLRNKAYKAMAKTHAKDLLDELVENGIRHDPKQIVGIGRRGSDGLICFIEEQGKGESGLAHVILRHKDDFLNKGLTEAQIPDLILKAVCEGAVVGVTGKDRPIFQTSFLGKVYNVAVTVGSNGFIVGAHPVTSF